MLYKKAVESYCVSLEALRRVKRTLEANKECLVTIIAENTAERPDSFYSLHGFNTPPLAA